MWPGSQHWGSKKNHHSPADSNLLRTRSDKHERKASARRDECGAVTRVSGAFRLRRRPLHRRRRRIAPSLWPTTASFGDGRHSYGEIASLPPDAHAWQSTQKPACGITLQSTACSTSARTAPRRPQADPDHQIGDSVDTSFTHGQVRPANRDRGLNGIRRISFMVTCAPVSLQRRDPGPVLGG